MKNRNSKNKVFLQLSCFGLLLVSLMACSEEMKDNIADSLSGCNTGNLNDDYPQSAGIDCLINLPNGIEIDDKGQSTVGVQFSPDGSELYTLSSGLQKWNSETWEEIDICEAADNTECHGEFYEKMYFTPENGVVAIQYSGKVYDGTTNNAQPLTNFNQSQFDFDQGNTERTEYIEGWDVFVRYNDNMIRFFHPETGEMLSEQEEPLGIDLIVGGRNYYATALIDSRILVLGLSEEYSGVLLQGHEASISNMIFSDDNTRLVSIDADGKVIVWDLTTGDKVMETVLDQMTNLTLANFVFKAVLDLSADNQLLVVRRDGSRLTFLDANSGEIIAETKLSGTILNIDISPDRSKLAIGYASKRTVTERKLDPSDRSVSAPKVEVESTSRGPAVVIDISGVNP